MKNFNATLNHSFVSKLMFILLFTFSVPAICNAQKDNKRSTEVEIFAKDIFDALKNNDYEKYSNYLLTINTYKEITEILFKNETKEEIDKFLQDRKRELPEYYKNSKVFFNKTRKETEEAGIVWNKTKFKKVEYEIRGEDAYAKGKSIKIYFEYLGADYYFELRKCFKTYSGWNIIDIRKVKAVGNAENTSTKNYYTGKYEYNEYDSFGELVSSSTLIIKDNNGTLNFDISVGHRDDCQGMLEGNLTKFGNVYIYSDEDCEKLIISFINTNTISVKEKNCMAHGFACSFEGVYKKVY